MGILVGYKLLLIVSFISTWPIITLSSINHVERFLLCFSSCLGLEQYSNSSLEEVVLTKSDPSYESVLQSTIRNTRFLNTSNVSKPIFIVTPNDMFQIQSAVVCSKLRQGIQIRVRSGGHDYEGLSYVSHSPFIIIDLVHLRSVDIDMEKETAWIESGATLGEFYYEIAKRSKVHGFPAGSCPTVGVGGHFSGGGFGTIFRKYGLASDNVIDAKVVDVNGRVLDRKLMGEDLFWAIRGGGGASFVVIYSWKVKLVHVPPIVTLFDIPKTLEQGASKLFEKWQTIADRVHEDLFLHTVIGSTNSSTGEKTIMISFGALYLGSTNDLLTLVKHDFPELGLWRNNCMEMSWIQSILYFAGYSIINDPIEVLLRNQASQSFKAKSDYVNEPIPQTGLEGLWEILVEEKSPMMLLTPYGGRMTQISDSETPFPHRKGNIYGKIYCFLGFR